MDNLKSIRSMSLTFVNHEKKAYAYEVLSTESNRWTLMPIIDDIQEVINGMNVALMIGHVE